MAESAAATGWLLALGSNAPDAAGRLDAAVDALAALGCVRRCSSRATGRDVSARGPRYLNQLVRVDSLLGRDALIAALKTIEREQGRTDRRDDGVCALDIDLLAALDGDGDAVWHDHKPLRIPAVRKLLSEIGVAPP